MEQVVEITNERGEIIRLTRNDIREIVKEALTLLYMEDADIRNLYSHMPEKKVWYRVWLSYDLGMEEEAEELTKKKYDKLYHERYAFFMKWLKDKDARECGYSTATFVCSTEENVPIVEILREDIKREFEKADLKELNGIRLYAIIALMEPSNSAIGGPIPDKIVYKDFIIGKRHDTNPWDKEY